jgi:hypothetical protein
MALRDIGKMELEVQDMAREGLNLLQMLLFLFLHVKSFFLTNKCSGDLGVPMCILVNFTHIMNIEWAIIKSVRRMITIFIGLMRCVSVKKLGVGHA